MLEKMSDVTQYYESLMMRPSGFPTPIIKKKSGSHQLSLSELGLPKSYIDFVDAYQIEDVVIGQLILTPCVGISLSEGLKQLNTKDKNPYVGNNMVHIADFEADLILVRKGDCPHSDGSVYFRDISTGYFPEPSKLADDFESFVILSSNLDKLVLDGVDSIEESMAGVLQILAPTLSSEDFHCWQQICTMVS